MAKVIKIIVSMILLGISAFYALGTYLVVVDSREDAVDNIKSYLQVEYLGSEYLGERAEINGDEKQAEEGYAFYKLQFQLENISSEVCFSGFDYLIAIDGEQYGEVRQVLTPLEYYPIEISPVGIYSTTIPVLPGKTQMDLIYYVEVQEGVEQLFARYYPTWDEDEMTLEFHIE